MNENQQRHDEHRRASVDENAFIFSIEQVDDESN